jgi:NTP pyrophosphatase (non-canonical NTP hydrolase)
MNYAELQVTTHFSFLRGVSSPEELFSAAALLGIKALGVVDRNSLAGMVRAHEAAKVTAVRLIVGCRLDLQCGTSLLVYPTDRAAYGRLCRLLTVGKARAGKGACHLDWPDVEGPAAKVEEELGEVRAQLHDHPIERTPQGAPVHDDRHAALEAELGDLLFAVVNLCRKAGVHASLALDKANAKFSRRFAEVERIAGERGVVVGEASLDELDAIWDEVKASE